MKKTMTRVVGLLVVFTLLFSLIGCVENTKPSQGAGSSTAASTPAAQGNQAAAVPAYSAADAEVVIKMYQYDGEYDLTKNSYVAYHQVFKDYVESHTDGRLFVELYPDSTLGNVDAMPEQCHNGIVEIISGQNASIYTSYVPEFCVFEIPFSFSSEEVLREYLRDDSLNEVKQKLIDVYDLRVLSVLSASFRWPMTSGAPIRGIDDMKGLNIRTSTGLLMERTYELLGANVYTTAFSEVLTSIQTGILDAWEGSIQTAFTSGYYEVTPYVNLYPVLGNIPTVTINETFFQSLSSEDQQILLAAARQADASFTGSLIGVNTTITKASMIANGAVMYQPTSEEIAQFKAATQDQAIQTAIENYGVDEAYIDSFLGTIAGIEERLNSREY